MTRLANIALLQTRPMPDFQSALDEAMGLANIAAKAGARFVMLPEYCGGLKSEGPALCPPASGEAENPFLQAFLAFARERQVWVMLGSIAIVADAGKILNRGYVIDDKGAIQSRYDKVHLFDVQLSAQEVYRESAHIIPGGKAVIVDTPFGRLGHTICYDLRFPHLYRDLAQAGAEIIAIPAAFTKKTGAAHWHVLNRARAIENGVFIVAPCAFGPIPGGGESYGHSLVVDPWGVVLGDGGEGPGIVQVQIDLDQVAATRARIPSLKHDRPYQSAGTEERNAS
jgi:deaminated glutathione amidase